MQVTFRKTDTLLLFGALTGLLIFFLLGMELFPEAGFRRSMNRGAVAERGLRLVQSLGYDLSEWPMTIELKADEDQLRYLYKNPHRSPVVEAIRDSVPVFTWQITWRPPMDSPVNEMAIHLGESGETSLGGWTSYRLILDADCKPLHFDYDDTAHTFIPVQQVSEGLDRNRAQRLSQRLLREEERRWIAEAMTLRESRLGPMRQYRWYRDEPMLEEGLGLSITLLNGRVTSFHKTYTPPKTEAASNGPLYWLIRLQPLTFVLLFILLIIHFVKRLRADLLDLRVGLAPAILLLLGWGIQLFMGKVAIKTLFVELIMGFVISGMVLGGLLWALFSVGESLTRQTWSDKLTTYDALRRRLLFPLTGLNVLRGLAAGLMGLGLYTGLVKLGLLWGNGTLALKASSLQFLASRGSSLFFAGDIAVCLFVRVCGLLPLCHDADTPLVEKRDLDPANHLGSLAVSEYGAALAAYRPSMGEVDCPRRHGTVAVLAFFSVRFSHRGHGSV